jgi:hypothetical protein
MLSETPFNPTGISVDAQADLLSFTTTKDHISCSISLLLRAASWGFDEIVKKFIDKGCDLTENNLKGETVLHKATRFAQLAVTVRLLRAVQVCNQLKNLLQILNTFSMMAPSCQGYTFKYKLYFQVQNLTGEG